MDEATWKTFTEYSNKYCKEHNLHKYESLKANWQNLNRMWTIIKEALLTTANKTVPCSYRSADDDISKPKSLTSCYSALKQLNNILLKFQTKFISRSLWPDVSTWTSSVAMIQQISIDH